MLHFYISPNSKYNFTRNSFYMLLNLRKIVQVYSFIMSGNNFIEAPSIFSVFLSINLSLHNM